MHNHGTTNVSGVPVYILAGGRSRRFGSDKARAMFNGEPLILHARRLLEPIASSVTVVADQPDKYADLDLRTIVDRSPGLGPLGGLDAALADLPDDQSWLLLCCCDAVVIRDPWLQQLLAARRPDSNAVVFRGDRWQPMPALYARSCHPHLAEVLDRDRRSMQQFLQRIDAAALPMPDDWPDNWQVNSMAELDAWKPVAS